MCLGLPWLQDQAVFCPTLDPCFCCRGGQEELVLLLGVERASGQLIVTCPRDREPSPSSRRLKTVKQTFLMLSPHMML